MRFGFLERRTQWPRVSTPAAPAILPDLGPARGSDVRFLHGTTIPFLPLPRCFPTGGRSNPPTVKEWELCSASLSRQLLQVALGKTGDLCAGASRHLGKGWKARTWLAAEDAKLTEDGI